MGHQFSGSIVSGGPKSPQPKATFPGLFFPVRKLQCLRMRWGSSQRTAGSSWVGFPGSQDCGLTLVFVLFLHWDLIHTLQDSLFWSIYSSVAFSVFTGLCSCLHSLVQNPPKETPSGHLLPPGPGSHKSPVCGCIYSTFCRNASRKIYKSIPSRKKMETTSTSNKKWIKLILV